jgi:hypothetical protein
MDIFLDDYTGSDTSAQVPDTWTPVTPTEAGGTWIDFYGQSGVYAKDLDGDGLVLDSPGEFLVFYDSTTDTAVTYAAKAADAAAGIVTGVAGGVDGVVVGVSHGSDGHTYVSGGIGTPGFSYYSQATNNISGLSTGWSGNYQVGTYHGSVSPSGAYGIGVGSWGTPGASSTYGIDVTNQVGALKAWIDGIFGY